ncbi:Hypothetical predicted protein [Octopus vulgaris]|uniref:Uncharacterized protein n=1 Tax=Octopus vulgaris TaxID=6645 RepID=A0AA36B506_OCTVU|nr:Hypothetical predicted protein [Octopus vulgaris]
MHMRARMMYNMPAHSITINTIHININFFSVAYEHNVFEAYKMNYGEMKKDASIFTLQESKYDKIEYKTFSTGLLLTLRCISFSLYHRLHCVVSSLHTLP